MDATGGWLARLRQPEYTGENRCLPCTAVNLVLALLASLAVGVGGTVAATAALGLLAATLVLGGSLAAIYFRGYLVPGTPELTKQYLPTRVLAWFGKAPAAAAATGATRPDDARPGDPTVDPEAVLLSVGALEECADRDDLCLGADFREAWYAEIDRVEAADADRDRLLSVLDLDAGAVRVEEFDTAFRAWVDDSLVGTWESQAAFLADLGGARVLADTYPGWDDLGVEGRSQLLGALRLFIDRCPACGGQPAFGTETVESCCTSHDVAAVSCADCGVRLFESRPV